MCGIAGIINPETKEKEKIIREMVSQIFHRGPDEDGFFIDENTALGMRRLSIIDLFTGKQPIISADGKLLIFLNGEIYNYKELREELINKGYVFKTQTDTEVVLYMFKEYGEKMLTSLRGMFAFCIYDIENKTIFLARDFFGIKPLYYLKNSEASKQKNSNSQNIKNEKILAFSSEIKSFLSFPDFKTVINDNAIYNYLSFQYNPLDETFFKNVYKLPPGHFIQIDVKTGNFEIKKYWSFELKPDESLEKEKTAKKIEETIYDSVKHHMIADVPVGAFLSSGIDSSIIAVMMQKIRDDKKIKTFTVGFDSLTEGAGASQTSDFLETEHKEIKIGPDEYFNILPKAIWHFDEPVADPSAIGLYFIAREASKKVKVVLSGEGADELFGGYNIYLTPFAYKKIFFIPKFFLKLILKIPFEFFGKNYIRRASQKLSSWYIGNAVIFKDTERTLLWKEKKQEKYSLSSLYENVKNLSDSSQMQYIDVNTWLIGDILAKADKMTMANSLELRVPFLDKKVSDLASILPDKFKWHKGKTKYLLREAFKNIIPEKTRLRKKLGFPVPIRDWFTKDRQDLYQKIYDCEYIKEKMNIDYIKKIIQDHIEKKNDNSRKIYILLVLALWYDKFKLKV
ncbi:MAG: asparagine synthase (glutamine-hydrolyzing) [bacterium]